MANNLKGKRVIKLVVLQTTVLPGCNVLHNATTLDETNSRVELGEGGAYIRCLHTKNPDHTGKLWFVPWHGIASLMLAEDQEG